MSRKQVKWILAAVAAVPLFIIMTHESCACGPHYPLWRKITMATVEPSVEAITKAMGFDFKLPRRPPG